MIPVQQEPLLPLATDGSVPGDLSALLEGRPRDLKLQVPEKGRQGVGFGVGLVADSLVDHLLPGLSFVATTCRTPHLTRRGHSHHINLVSLLLATLCGEEISFF